LPEGDFDKASANREDDDEEEDKASVVPVEPKKNRVGSKKNDVLQGEETRRSSVWNTSD
jgi:hypothetical protein